MKAKRLLSSRVLADRLAQAELIAQAAQQQKKLARAELEAARKTFKRARKVAKKAGKKSRRAAAKAEQVNGKRFRREAKPENPRKNPRGLLDNA